MRFVCVWSLISIFFVGVSLAKGNSQSEQEVFQTVNDKYLLVRSDCLSTITSLHTKYEDFVAYSVGKDAICIEIKNAVIKQRTVLLKDGSFKKIRTSLCGKKQINDDNWSDRLADVQREVDIAVGALADKKKIDFGRWKISVKRESGQYACLLSWTNSKHRVDTHLKKDVERKGLSYTEKVEYNISSNKVKVTQDGTYGEECLWAAEIEKMSFMDFLKHPKGGNNKLAKGCILRELDRQSEEVADSLREKKRFEPEDSRQDDDSGHSVLGK